MAKWSAGALEIQTRSVEKVLLPLVAQVSILVNNGVRENVEATKAALLNDVLANLEASICKFTSIGLEMGNCNDEIRDDMSEACDVANKACITFVSSLRVDENGNVNHVSLTDSARSLLSAITRILILSDKTAISKMAKSLNKVDRRLGELESVSNFTEFVTAFSQFGSDMVELATVSGERQNDLKDDLQRAEVCASRAILEKSTMMLLTTCKTCLRHPESPLASGNRTSVFRSMRNAMGILRSTIQENKYPDSNISRGIMLDFKELEDCVVTALSNDRDFSIIDSLCERLDNIAIDMDDVINVCEITQSSKTKLKTCIIEIKEKLKKLRMFLQNETVVGDSSELQTLLQAISTTTKNTATVLVSASSEQVRTLLSDSPHKETLRNMKGASLAGELQDVQTFGEELEKNLNVVVEVSKLIKNSCYSEACIITASRIEENLQNLLPQVVDAGKMLSAHPSSKITQENLEVFIDVWDTQLDELISLFRNINDANEGTESAEWLSIYVPMASKLSSQK